MATCNWQLKPRRPMPNLFLKTCLSALSVQVKKRPLPTRNNMHFKQNKTRGLKASGFFIFPILYFTAKFLTFKLNRSGFLPEALSSELNRSDFLPEASSFEL